MMRVRKATGLNVPTSQLFATPTIAGLAEALERTDTGGEEGLQPIPRAAFSAEQRAAGVPCSANQEQMLLLHAMLPDSAAYNMSLPLRLEGEPDAAALEVHACPSLPCNACMLHALLRQHG